MHSALERIDANRIRVRARDDLDIVLFANAEVFLDPASVEEILHFATIVDTLAALNARDYFADTAPALDRVAVTPDFHKAAGIPVGTVLATRGFVVPAAIGNDINCGMRVHVTTLTPMPWRGRMDDLETAAAPHLLRGRPQHPDDARQRTGDVHRWPAGPARRRAATQARGCGRFPRGGTWSANCRASSRTAACAPTASSAWTTSWARGPAQPRFADRQHRRRQPLRRDPARRADPRRRDRPRLGAEKVGW